MCKAKAAEIRMGKSFPDYSKSRLDSLKGMTDSNSCVILPTQTKSQSLQKSLKKNWSGVIRVAALWIEPQYTAWGGSASSTHCLDQPSVCC